MHHQAEVAATSRLEEHRRVDVSTIHVHTAFCAEQIKAFPIEQNLMMI